MTIRKAFIENILLTKTGGRAKTENRVRLSNFAYNRRNDFPFVLALKNYERIKL